LQLLYNFPVDHKDNQGQQFWSGLKRAPKALEFDTENEEHMNFIISAANLCAFTYNVDPKKRTVDHNAIKNILKTISVPSFEPKKGITIKENDQSTVEEGGSDDNEVVVSLSAELLQPHGLSEPSTTASNPSTKLKLKRLLVRSFQPLRQQQQ
jgi:ubiquitin-activating enzyme E1